MRETIAIFLFMMIPGLVCSQTRYFDYYYKTPVDDAIYDVQEDDAGNFYLLATSRQNIFNNAQTTTHVIKLDKDGNLLSTTTIEPQNYIMSLRKLIRYDNQHFLAAGNMSETDDGTSKIVIVKFDLDLNVVWAKNFKNSDPDQYVEDIQYSRDSSHFLMSGQNGKNGYFAKVSLMGDSLELKNYSFIPPVFFFEILELPSNTGYYIFSYGGHMPNNSSIPKAPGIRLIKLRNDLSIDTVVVLQTSLTYPHLTDNVPFDNFVSARWMSDQSFIVGGRVSNHKEMDISYNAGDMGLMEWDTNFNEAFYAIYGRYDTTEFSGLSTMDFRDTASIYLAGTGDFYHDFYADKLIDFYLVKTNSKGIPKWERHYDNNSFLVMYSVLATSDGGAMIVGSSYKEGLNGPQERDGYLVKVDSNGNSRITPVGVVEYHQSDLLTIYPNPFEEQIIVKAAERNDLWIDLYDLYGRNIIHQLLPQGSGTISTAHLSGGIYFYTVSGNNGVTGSGKVVKK